MPSGPGDNRFPRNRPRLPRDWLAGPCYAPRNTNLGRRTPSGLPQRRPAFVFCSFLASRASRSGFRSVRLRFSLSLSFSSEFPSLVCHFVCPRTPPVADRRASSPLQLRSVSTLCSVLASPPPRLLDARHALRLPPSQAIADKKKKKKKNRKRKTKRKKTRGNKKANKTRQDKTHTGEAGSSSVVPRAAPLFADRTPCLTGASLLPSWTGTAGCLVIYRESGISPPHLRSVVLLQNPPH